MAIALPWSPGEEKQTMKPLEALYPAPPSHLSSSSAPGSGLTLGRPLRSPRRVFLFYAASVLLGLVIGLPLLALAPCRGGAHCYRGYYSLYSFDAAAADQASWMSRLPDHLPLASLSIPGTHDTMTYGIASETLQCQNWNLTTQLAAGVRYLDIRARLRDDRLHIYHAGGYTGFSFEDVLSTVFAFLDASPAETVILRLKEEGRPVGANNSISFEDAFNYQRLEAPATAAGSAKHLYIYNRTAPLPTLGDLRAKVLLLQEFPTKNAKAYGVEWDGTQMTLEDYWIVPGVYYLADKWRAIRSALEEATMSPLDNTRLFLSHISASVGVLPIEAAAGPMNRTIVGMNDMTGQWLADFDQADEAVRVGVVIFDFPGKDAIRNVLRWNRHVHDEFVV